MEFLFWFFGVFCLAYYGVIVCYSGPSTSFAPIWLVLSACLFIIATVVHFYDRFRDRISLRLEVTADSGYSTTVSIVMLDSERERHFAVEKGSKDYFGLSHINLDMVKESAIVSIGSNLSLKSLDGEPTCELFSHARKHGVITVADYSIGKGDEKVDRSMVSAMFRQTDYILPSYAEASLITGETEIRRIIEALQDMGAANIVLKLGGKGCYLHANGIDKMIEAYPARVVDTTGAGDCFAAGFIYGVAKGMDVEVCARLGCAAGSIAVEAVGANTALRSREQIYRRAGMQMDDR